MDTKLDLVVLNQATLDQGLQATVRWYERFLRNER
jgi:hypothetical protein